MRRIFRHKSGGLPFYSLSINSSADPVFLTLATKGWTKLC